MALMIINHQGPGQLLDATRPTTNASCDSTMQRKSDAPHATRIQSQYCCNPTSAISFPSSTINCFVLKEISATLSSLTSELALCVLVSSNGLMLVCLDQTEAG